MIPDIEFTESVIYNTFFLKKGIFIIMNVPHNDKAENKRNNPIKL